MVPARLSVCTHGNAGPRQQTEHVEEPLPDHRLQTATRTSLPDAPNRVPGFPGWTHLLATVAFPVWSIGTDAYYYGISTTNDWWQDLTRWDPFWVVLVSIFVLPPAVALEAVAVLRLRGRWVARLAVICYVLIAGFVTFFPAEFRLAGATLPIRIEQITTSLISYAIVVAAQVLLTYLICRLWLRRTTPG